MKLNILLLLFVFGIGWLVTDRLDQKSVGQSAYKTIHDFEMVLLSGETQNLSTITKSQDVIIHFWATWCAPCLVEFPTLIEFAMQQQKDIQIIAIAVQDTPEAVRKFVDKLSKPLTDNVYIVIDKEWRIAKDIFGTRKLPESFYLNSDLTIHARHNGAKEDWLSSDWISEFLNKNSE